MKVLAIGFGNTLRGDDGAGCELATILERSEPGVIVLVRHALVPELATALAGADGVLFLDARAGPERGRIHSTAVTPAEGAGAPGHGLTPDRLLDLSRTLYGCRAEAHLVTIESDRFDPGAAMSREVKGALPDAIAVASNVISRWRMERAAAPASKGAATVA